MQVQGMNATAATAVTSTRRAGDLLLEAADLVEAAARLVAEANRLQPDRDQAQRDEIALALAWASVDLEVAACVDDGVPGRTAGPALPSRVALAHRRRMSAAS